MFERFTDRARRAVVLAQEEARGLSCQEINSGHLLLGLSGAGGVASQVLADLGFDTEDVRAMVMEPGQGAAGHLPFTTEAKTALQMGLREGLSLGHNYIGTEHLLLGLLRDQMAGQPGQVALLDVAPLLEIRSAVLSKLGSYERRPDVGWFGEISAVINDLNRLGTLSPQQVQIIASAVSKRVVELTAPLTTSEAS